MQFRIYEQHHVLLIRNRGSSVDEASTGIQIWACFFHFGEAIWRRVADLGLRTPYIQNGYVRIFAKMLAAFLNSNLVNSVFEQLDELRHNNNLDILAPLYATFENTYIGRQTKSGREGDGLCMIFKCGMLETEWKAENK